MTVQRDPQRGADQEGHDPNLRVFAMSATVTDPEAFFSPTATISVKHKKLNGDEVVQVYSEKVQDRWRVSNVFEIDAETLLTLEHKQGIELEFV